MSDLMTFVREHVCPALNSDGDRRKMTVAANHLKRLLEREPEPADLNEETLAGVLDLLHAEGRQAQTRGSVRDSLAKLCRVAVDAGILPAVPKLPEVSGRKSERPQPLPWDIGQLNRLLASARTMPGNIDGVPSKLWWPAFLMTMLDTGATARELIDVPRTGYKHQHGTLTAGPLVCRLHPLAIEAIDLIRRHEASQLFPWPFDQHEGPLCTLYRRMKQLLYRAGLPHTAANQFKRLRVTTRAFPQILDQVNLQIEFTPRKGKPRLAKTRDLKRWSPTIRTAVAEASWDNADVPAVAPRRPRQSRDVYLLQPIDASQSLRGFFENSYRPLRLAQAKPETIVDFHTCLDRFGWFLGCEPTFTHLDEDLVERFLAWLLESGKRQPVTVNRYRVHILALWRHAWRKRKVDELPRDVTKLKVPKRLPEAWSLDELGQILDAAAQAEGDFCGIPAGQWWTALILTLYDTGMRINALLLARMTDYDAPWLTVPAEHQKQKADQSFRLHPDTVAAIESLGTEQREQLFPWPFSLTDHQSLWNRYREILKRAGLPHSSRHLFHKLRRTSATHLVNATDEATAQKHLGHSSRQVTERYLDPRKLTRTSAADVMERPQWRVVRGADDVA